MVALELATATQYATAVSHDLFTLSIHGGRAPQGVCDGAAAGHGHPRELLRCRTSQHPPNSTHRQILTTC
eukprot:6340442-Pyramimonas_sp.AAC.1